eukprot:10864511-Heterocapsa_arctica.AAC.1
MHNIERPLRHLPFAFAMSMRWAIRTSRSPFTTALRAVASLASKDRQRGSTKMQSSGIDPFIPASHSQAVQTSSRPEAAEAIWTKVRRHSANVPAWGMPFRPLMSLSVALMRGE